MSIWFKPMSLEDFARLDKGLHERGTLMQTLGIKVTEIGEDYLVAAMPVDASVHNPVGIVHGGTNVVLAETVASYAANFVVDFEKYYCVGQEINANHIRASRKGVLTAVAKPVHIGKRSSVWNVEINNSGGELVCVSRMTAAVVKR
ncbi:PaaI family thioesterase [Shewanella sp. 202IG2-18]|uniref:PaaI family thioesterase n=1 Tax=Parashewanella hymeniacidonis TaxID=2807618 RepID=UPI0019613204|nr:PaaI family thioesterase [Parashewanella hymeniacidonis]MBM7073801.1 PaaI family thioesterase [Parashewanella hymeniacidonis]